VLRGSYRGLRIVSMPPPSSGGVVLLEMLNVLEGFKLKADDPDSTHLLVEAMRYAYADRAHLLGDPDFVKAPIAGLLSKRYAATCAPSSTASAPTPSDKIKAADPAGFEGDNTTHYSVVDRFGNAVANTYTINLSYGVGLIAEGTGVLLNNELDDFAAAPGVPNAFGLVGYEANEPGTEQAAALLDDADHRAPQRQAGDRHRLAGRQPHHHGGVAGAGQRHRSTA
jgi:gamma-glutamyltranspeptidase/glutathione hydrolase